MEGLSMISAGSAMLVIRLILGTAMIHYGWGKVRNLKRNARDFDRRYGLRPGWLSGDIVAFVEFAGGIAVMTGTWAALAAAAFAFQMLTGLFWKLKFGKSFGDYSYDLQLFALCMAVVVFGPGSHTFLVFDRVALARWDILIAAVIIAFTLAALAHPKPVRRRK